MTISHLLHRKVEKNSNLTLAFTILLKASPPKFKTPLGLLRTRYIYIYIYVYVYIYIHTHTHRHTHTYIHTHPCVCVSVCEKMLSCKMCQTQIKEKETVYFYTLFK